MICELTDLLRDKLQVYRRDNVVVLLLVDALFELLLLQINFPCKQANCSTLLIVVFSHIWLDHFLIYDWIIFSFMIGSFPRLRLDHFLIYNWIISLFTIKSFPYLRLDHFSHPWFDDFHIYDWNWGKKTVWFYLTSVEIFICRIFLMLSWHCDNVWDKRSVWRLENSWW